MQNNMDWVSIEKKYPPVGVKVLVCSRNGKMAITSRQKSANGKDRWKGSSTFNDSITHWMYLPEPPIISPIEKVYDELLDKVIGLSIVPVSPCHTESILFDKNAPVSEHLEPVKPLKVVSHDPLTEEEYKLLSEFIGDDAKFLVETACKVRHGIEHVIDRYDDGSVTINTMWCLAGCLYKISPDKIVRIIARS